MIAAVLIAPRLATRLHHVRSESFDGTAAASGTGAVRASTNGKGQPTFESDVLPILERRCVECHGETKRKGGLRLDRATSIFAGDPSTWRVRPGDPERSELLRRALLPPSDEDRMPPKGEPLSPVEIEAIRAWIVAGAAWTRPQPKLEFDGAENIAGLSPTPTAPPDSARERAAMELAKSLGARLARRSESDAALDANLAFVNGPILDAALDALTPLAPRLAEVNLARTAATDKHMDTVARFTRLETLHLEGTSVGDDGVQALTGLNRLEYLNLHSTKITDQALRAVAGMSSLRRLFVYATLVSEGAVARLRADRPELTVESGAISQTR